MMTGVQTAASIMQEWQAPRPVAGRRLIHRPSEFPPLEPAVREEGEGLKSLEAAARHSHTHPFVIAATAYGDELDCLGSGRPSECLRLIDRGRVEAIDKVCNEAGKESWLSRYVLNVYRIHIRKLLPVGPGQRVLVLTGLEKTSSHRSAFLQRLVDADTGDLLLDAVVEVLFLDSKRQLVPIPDEFPGGPGPDVEARDEPVKPVPFSDGKHFSHHVPFRVYYEDTDAQGIAYHVTYFRYCERALFELLRAAADGEDPAGAGAPAVSSIDIRYLKAAVLGDRLEVRTGVRRVEGGTLVVDQRIVREGRGQVVCDVTLELNPAGPSAILGILEQMCS